MLLTFLLISSTCAVLEAVEPPAVIRQPSPSMYFIPGTPATLVCSATGDPPPTYTWKKDGLPVSPHNRINQDANGTLIFSRTEADDDGVYQCFARNIVGQSVSNAIKFRRAFFNRFFYRPPMNHTPTLGHSLTLPCIPPWSQPYAQVEWVIIRDQERFDVEPVTQDARVHTDHEGRLRFAAVLPEDEAGGHAYVCTASNAILRQVNFGPSHYVRPQGSTPEFQPAYYLWSSPDYMRALEGKSLKLMCLFSGMPVPTIEWTKDGSTGLPENARVGRFERELIISDVQPSNAGTYLCTGTNSPSRQLVTRAIHVVVQSVPTFESEPQDTEVTSGENVEFDCTAAGVPEPRISWYINSYPLRAVASGVSEPQSLWYINGTPLRDLPIGRRLNIVNDTKLSIDNVQPGDSMVIQCNASNVHGYAFADFFLNVMSPSHYEIV